MEIIKTTEFFRRKNGKNINSVAISSRYLGYDEMGVVDEEIVD